VAGVGARGQAVGMSGDRIITEVGDLLTTWVGIQMDTIDAMVADAQAKVDALPDYHILCLLIGELVVQQAWMHEEIKRLKGGQS
jgi:hypothetical protein